MFHVPEQFRIVTGPHRTNKMNGNNGAFWLRTLKLKRALFCIASDGEGWEHVSVSLHDRCPTWEEMSFVKSLFWDEDDLVIQFHPPKSEHISNHPYCLHLWRKCGSNAFCETPDKVLVGV